MLNFASRCTICMMEIKEDEEVREVHLCGHIFHADCLDRWLKVKEICPLCKTKINKYSLNPAVYGEEPATETEEPIAQIPQELTAPEREIFQLPQLQTQNTQNQANNRTNRQNRGTGTRRRAIQRARRAVTTSTQGNQTRQVIDDLLLSIELEQFQNRTMGFRGSGTATSFFNAAWRRELGLENPNIVNIANRDELELNWSFFDSQASNPAQGGGLELTSLPRRPENSFTGDELSFEDEEINLNRNNSNGLQTSNEVVSASRRSGSSSEGLGRAMEIDNVTREIDEVESRIELISRRVERLTNELERKREVLDQLRRQHEADGAQIRAETINRLSDEIETATNQIDQMLRDEIRRQRDRDESGG